MQIKMGVNGMVNGPSEVVITHKDKELVWNTSPLDKTSFSAGYDVFEQLNAYWKTLSDQEQDALFDIYQEIRNTFDEVWDPSERSALLVELIAKLYGQTGPLVAPTGYVGGAQHIQNQMSSARGQQVSTGDSFKFHDLVRIRHWTDYYADLYIPDNVSAEFTQADSPYDRKGTYVREEYRWLVALAIALRAMIPIWGEFIAQSRKEIGTQFKEYEAMRLLRKAEIFEPAEGTWPEEGTGRHPMERLRDFIDAKIPADKSKDAAIIVGVGTERFPEWLLGLVLVRRLCVGDVRGVDRYNELVSYIWKYVNSKVKGHDTSFAGIVKPKEQTGERLEGDNNISKLEGYKLKEQVPAGDIAALSWYTEDIQRMALRVEPNLPLEMLSEAIQAVDQLQNEQIMKCQVTISQWVMKPAVQPRGQWLLKKDAVMRCLAATTAILWYHGHYEIAALVSGIAQQGGDELILGGGDNGARIPTEQQEEINRLYPYFRRTASKNKDKRQPNAAVTSIESLREQFGEYLWKLTLPTEWVKQVTGNGRNRRYNMPYEIRVKLAKLVIAIATRKN